MLKLIVKLEMMICLNKNLEHFFIRRFFWYASCVNKLRLDKEKSEIYLFK